MGGGLGRGGAGETGRIATGQFVDKGRPHLLDRVGEAEFEDATGDGGEQGLIAQILDLPY